MARACGDVGGVVVAVSMNEELFGRKWCIITLPVWRETLLMYCRGSKLTVVVSGFSMLALPVVVRCHSALLRCEGMIPIKTCGAPP